MASPGAGCAGRRLERRVGRVPSRRSSRSASVATRRDAEGLRSRDPARDPCAAARDDPPTSPRAAQMTIADASPICRSRSVAASALAVSRSSAFAPSLDEGEMAPWTPKRGARAADRRGRPRAAETRAGRRGGNRRVRRLRRGDDILARVAGRACRFAAARRRRAETATRASDRRGRCRASARRFRVQGRRRTPRGTQPSSASPRTPDDGEAASRAPCSSRWTARRRASAPGDGSRTSSVREGRVV